jgi:ribose transport system permease protein
VNASTASAAPATTDVPPPGVPAGIRRLAETRFLGVLVLLVALLLFFSLTEERFLTSRNVEAMLTGAAILWLVSIGLTFVMISGGIDLSMGSMLALVGVMLGVFVNDLGLPVLVAVVLVLLTATALGGLTNGFLIGRLQLSFLVFTLGTLSLFRGVLNLWSDGQTTQVVSSSLDAIAFNHVFGAPVPVLIMAATYLVARYVLQSTYFGRDVYAVGGNPAAARVSGISVARTVALVYAIAALFAALAGVLQVARIGAASPLVGETIIFDAAAAVLIGGTSFAGGSGGVTGTAVGVLFLAVLQNGLATAGVESFWQQVVSGVILIAAVLLDRLQRGDWVGLRAA